MRNNVICVDHVRLLQQPKREATTDRAVEVETQLRSLLEVSSADDLAAQGRRSEAAPLLERAVEICASSMGTESPLAQAAMHR